MSSTTSSTLKLTEQLISRNSVTPDNACCQRSIADCLEAPGPAGLTETTAS